jgi:hypothetical protein
MYTTPVMGFIDEHCAVFDDEEENKLEFTVVHAEFKRLVESLLSDFLREVGVPPERFVDVLANSAHDELNDFVLASILTVDDFPQFKAMMVRRNAELDREAADALRDADAANVGPPTPDTAEATRAEVAEVAEPEPEPEPSRGGVGPAAGRKPDPGPDPHSEDGFDEAAILAAIRASEASLELDRARAKARREEAVSEAERLARQRLADQAAAKAMAEAAAATERAVRARAAADPNFDAGAFIRAHQIAAEEAARARGGAGAGGQASASALDDASALDPEEDAELREAMALSAKLAAEESEAEARERAELEAAMAESLAVGGGPPRGRGDAEDAASDASDVASGSGNPPSATATPTGKGKTPMADVVGAARDEKAAADSATERVVDRLSAPPLGKLPPLGKPQNASKSSRGVLPALARPAGYKQPSAGEANANANANATSAAAVRAAAERAAKTQTALVRDAPSSGLDLVRRQQHLEDQRAMLVARKAAERERELAEFAANGQTAYSNPLYSSGTATPRVEREAAEVAGGASEKEQERKREALRAQLARRMKAELVRRNAWDAEEARG